MDNKFQLAKNYNIQQDYTLNAYIDTKDTVNHWCVGQIVDVNEANNQLRVHFEGWSARYDEWIKKNSQRLAPFRRHTEGYTGQKKTTLRDFKFSLVNHKVKQQQVQEIIANDFKGFPSPSHLTQFIRGELYFYVDSLMSIFATSSVDEVPAIFDFMKDIFSLIFKWIEIFPQHLPAFQDSLHHPQLYLVSYEAAIAQCGNEFFNILEKCFGRCSRGQKFFQKYQGEHISTEGDESFVAKEKLKGNGLQASFLNAFGNLKGFEKVLNFIQFDIKDSKDKLIKGCPFQLVMKILRSLQSVFELADKNFSENFAQDVCFSLTYRLDNLSENEIKELDKDILKGIIEVFKEYMFIINPQQEAEKVAELRELQVAQKYLKCPFFEKRVRGINEFKEIYYKVYNGTIKNRQNEQYEQTKWLTMDKYSQWLIEEKIIDFIFLENPHVELIKRSTEIMKLLASDERFFSNDIIDMIWICCSEKHEDIVRATLDLVQELALIMPLEKLGYFSTKLRSIKDNEIDEKMVLFLKNYTLNTMKNIRRLRQGESRGIMNTIMNKKKDVKIDEQKYIDLLQLWRIFQDSNKVSQKVKDLALNSLIELLQDSSDKEIKDQYIFLALENMKTGNTFYSSLIFLRKILNTFPLESQIKYKGTSGASVLTVQTVLHEIVKKQDLFELILVNLQEYMRNALGQIQRMQILPEKAQTTALSGFTTHEDFISAVTGFIEFVLVNSKITLTFEHVEKMFKLMVTQALTEFESNALFEFITKENQNAKSKERRFLLDDKVRNEVFMKIFCNCNSKYMNFEKLNTEGFSCFKRLFLIVNEEEKALEVQRDDRVVVVNLQQLQGLDTLWAIATMCENTQVKDTCRDFLVDLYLRIKIKSAAQKKQINEIFPQRCFAHFKGSTDRPDVQLNCLKLIKNFIFRFDGEHLQEEDMSQFPANEIKTINVTLNPEKINITVKAHPSQKLWQVKRKMANAYKMKLSEFFIKTKQGPLEESVYDEQLKEYKIEALHINRYARDDMEKEFPRYLIGYNKEYLNQFLDLLKSGKEECKREVLSLLEMLPINIDVKLYMRDTIFNKFTQVADKQQIEWQKLFYYNKQDSNYQYCTYYLMTLEELIIAKKDSLNQEANQLEVQQKQEFSVKFLQNGGFQFLFELFLQIDKRKLERDIIRTKLLNILVKILLNLLSLKLTPSFKAAVTADHIKQLIKENLSIIENFIDSLNVQQQTELTPADLKDVRLLRRETYIFTYSMSFLNRALQSNHHLISTLYGYPNINKIMRTALVDLDIKIIQESLSTFIQDISIKLDNNADLELKPSFFFMKLFLNDCLDYSLKIQKLEKTKKYFEVVNEIFLKTEVHRELHNILPPEQLVKQIAEMIYQREIKEISARDEDFSLQGLFMLLKNIFQKFPEVRETFVTKNEFLKYLIHDCLFHKETRGQLIQKAKAMPPKCKNNNTRDRCLELLNELCINNVDGIYILIRYLKEHLSETFWRTPRRADWYITVHQQERSLTGFVGLKNIGCICYMNSIMQQLFMIPPFRKAILEVEDSNFGKEPTDENVLHQLKMIFGGLMEMEKQYFNPKKFCSAFKDIDGSSIDPMVQKDVDEFFNMAMDRIENLVKGKKEDKVIKNLFQGVLANEFICKGCPHYSEREEPFMTISLQVKNKHSIKESLEAFVEGEMLEGDNAYYCEKCEKKVNTLKRCCIKRMPNVLFMVLKRFEFNFDTMTKFKINDYCEFPMQINMREYSQEMLAKRDLLKMMEDKNMTMEDLSEEQRAVLDRDLPAKYYDYNLRGTVVHMGTADQGHYISYIQDREGSGQNKWYEFNDHLVKEFDPEDIAYETFGGEDESFMQNMNMNQMQGSGYNEQMIQAMKQLKTKIKNAYILIYERDEAIDMERFNEFMDDPNVNTNKQDIAVRFEQCKLPKTTSAQIQIPPSVHDFILEKNKKFWLSKFIFNKSYIESVLNIFMDIRIDEDMDYSAARETELQQNKGSQFEVFKFLTTFFLTTVIRARDRKNVPNYMQLIREALQKNVALSLWLLETFSNQDLIKEFMIDCPIPDMKRFVAGLLRTAMLTVYKFEEEAIKNYCVAIDSGIVDYIMQTQGVHFKGHKTIDMKMQTKGGESIQSGPCLNLNYIQLSHHNEKLPMLIIMINSFIHMGVSPHCFFNTRLSGQFHQLFAHFAEVGPATRLYLLKTRHIGRSLDILFYGSQGNPQKPQLTEKFRALSLEIIPMFSIEKDLYIHSNLEKNDFKMSAMDKKIILNDATTPHQFLVYTVSKLARSCVFAKDSAPSQFSNDNLNFKLDDDEIGMIINHEKNQFWDLCDQKIVRNAVADMFAHISFENKDFSLQYIQTLITGLQRVSFDNMKAFERPLIRMLLINDQYQMERTKKIFGSLYELMKITLSCYKDMDSLIEIAYKMLQRSDTAVEYCQKQPNFMRLIEQWCKENPHIPLNQQKMKVFRQGLISYSSLKQNMINQTTIDKMKEYTMNRTLRMQQLVSKDTPTSESMADSDDDMYHHQYTLKERVDFYDSQNISQTGTVEIVLDEMVHCVSEVTQTAPKPVQQWIPTECDRIGPPNTLTIGNEKRRWHQFYLVLLRTIQQ